MCNLSKGIENMGIEKGIKKGIETGIERGIKKGSYETAAMIVKRMLARNMPMDTIKDLTGLSDEEIKQIINEDDNQRYGCKTKICSSIRTQYLKVNARAGGN